MLLTQVGFQEERLPLIGDSFCWGNPDACKIKAANRHRLKVNRHTRARGKGAVQVIEKHPTALIKEAAEGKNTNEMIK